MRCIKLRSWNEKLKKFFYFKDGRYFSDIKCELVNCVSERICDDFKWSNAQQFSNILDKNGVEIYEYMEIDNTYEVSFLNGSYVLTDISNGDIMLLSNYMENNNGKVEITREYTKV